MGHKNLKTREQQLAHIMGKVDRIWTEQLDKNQYLRLRLELQEEIEEWFCYWHKRYLKSIIKEHK